MTDLEYLIIWLTVIAAIVLPVLAIAAWRDFRSSKLARELRLSFGLEAPPPPPSFTLLRSANGNVPLAQLRNGELRSLKPEPKGKAQVKLWKRIARQAPNVAELMRSRGGHRRPALIAALKRQAERNTHHEHRPLSS